MTVFDNIFDIVLPDHLAQRRFEFADRLKSQHSIFLRVALCTLGLQAQVGQAGIGAIDQVQVSNYSPVPQDAVIAQPQMLFLVLDQHLNRPAFQIVGDDFLHRGVQIIGHQCDMFPIILTAREYNLHLADFIQPADAFGQSVGLGLSQAGDPVPTAAVVQDIPAVCAQTVGLRFDLKTPIGSRNADKMPLSGLAGIDHFGTQIEGIKQHRDLEMARQLGLTDGLTGQLGQLLKVDSQSAGMLFFDIQQRRPRDGDAAIVQTDLDNGMACAVCAGGMVKQFADGIHLFGAFEGLGVIDDKEQIAVFLMEQAAQQVQCNLLHDHRLAPVAAPQKLAVIGAMGAVSHQLDEFVNSAAMTETHGQNERPEIVVNMAGYLLFDRAEKTLQFLGNSADSNHTASVHISISYQNTYRHKRLFLFNDFHRHENANRSV